MVMDACFVASFDLAAWRGARDDAITARPHDSTKPEIQSRTARAHHASDAPQIVERHLSAPRRRCLGRRRLGPHGDLLALARGA